MENETLISKVVSYSKETQTYTIEPITFKNGTTIKFVGSSFSKIEPGTIVEVTLHSGIIPRLIPKRFSTNYIIVKNDKELHNTMGELIIAGYQDHCDVDWTDMIKFDLTLDHYEIGIQINEELGFILPVHIADNVSIHQKFQSFTNYKLFVENCPNRVKSKFIKP